MHETLDMFRLASVNDSFNKDSNSFDKNSTSNDSNSSAAPTETTKQTTQSSIVTDTKKLTIIGDSLINGILPSWFDKCENIKVKVKPFGGSTTEDMLDHVRPILKRKPDMLIFHVGTNDLTNKIDTIENLEKLVTQVKDANANIQIAISYVLTRADRRGFDGKIKKLNAKLSKFCLDNSLKFIEHKNITTNFLSRKKLHLNPKGIQLLGNNFISFLNN